MTVLKEETGVRRRRRGIVDEGVDLGKTLEVKEAAGSGGNGEGKEKGGWEGKAKGLKSIEEGAFDGKGDVLGVFRGYERYLRVLIFVVSYWARFYKLGEPKQVVFDEFHFGKFVNWTLERKYYFDIHPPLGKLLLAGWGWLRGYEPVAGFNYDSIGAPMGSTLFFPLREFSAFVGALTPVIAYDSCRLLGFHPSTASIVAFCLALDNLLIVESRLILVDSQLIFFCVLSMYCALVLWRTTRPGTFRRWLWLAITGAAAGAAFGIKWTALAYPGMIAIISFFGLYLLDEPLSLLECLFAGMCGLVVYAIPYYIHFKLLIYSGTGDNFMEPSFRHCLLNNAGYDPKLVKPSFLYNFIYLNKRMFISNKGISDTHHWASKWYQWIVNWRGVLYFRHYLENSPPGKPYKMVYLFSNPFVTWLALASITVFVIALVFLARYRDTKVLKDREDHRNEFVYLGTFCLVSWLVNLLPYILVDRSSFAYHYLPGLYYGEIMIGLLVNSLPRRLRIFTSILVISIIVASFVYWSPWIYAIPMTEADHNARRWLPRWD